MPRRARGVKAQADALREAGALADVLRETITLALCALESEDREERRRTVTLFRMKGRQYAVAIERLLSSGIL